MSISLRNANSASRVSRQIDTILPIHAGGGQFVLVLPASFQVGSKFVSGKERTFLKAKAMVAEDSNVRGDRDLLRQASVSVHGEPIHVGVLPLVKAEIPDLHEFPLPAD